MSQQFYSGVGGTASVGNPPLELPITDWDVARRAQTTRFRNSKSGPAASTSSKPTGSPLTVTISSNTIFYEQPVSVSRDDTGRQPVDQRETVFASIFAFGQLDGPAWTFASLVVTATPQTLPQTGRNITTRLTCSSDGLFTYPS